MSGFLIYSTEVSSASAARASEFEKRVATQSGKQLDRARAASREFAGVISEVEGSTQKSAIEHVRKGLDSAKGKALLLEAAYAKTRTAQLSAVHRRFQDRRAVFLPEQTLVDYPNFGRSALGCIKPILQLKNLSAVFVRNLQD